MVDSRNDLGFFLDVLEYKDDLSHVVSARDQMALGARMENSLADVLDKVEKDVTDVR
jgi:hypothetical protein